MMNVPRWIGLTRSTLLVAVLLYVASSAVLLPSGAAACEFETEWYQTFYAEPEQITVVGECYRPCFGWPSCTGTRTSYYSIASWECGGSCSP
jgi:hypothetical protein